MAAIDDLLNRPPQGWDLPGNNGAMGWSLSPSSEAPSPPGSEYYPLPVAKMPNASAPMGANDWISKYQQAVSEFGRSHPGANPSVTNDPSYWARRIYETNGSTPDWGFWQGRMMQPEGPPEGASQAPPGMNYQQALQYVGLSPNDPRINGLFQRFGGTPNDTFTTAGLNPVIQYLRTIANAGAPPTDVLMQVLPYLMRAGLLRA